MRKRTIVGRLLFVVLACVSGLAQESYEDRAARLQPEDIPPLIQKAQNGDRSSQVLLWLAYSGGHGVPKDAKQGVPYLRQAAEQGSTRGPVGPQHAVRVRACWPAGRSC